MEAPTPKLKRSPYLSSMMTAGSGGEAKLSRKAQESKAMARKSSFGEMANETFELRRRTRPGKISEGQAVDCFSESLELLGGGKGKPSSSLRRTKLANQSSPALARHKNAGAPSLQYYYPNHVTMDSQSDLIHCIDDSAAAPSSLRAGSRSMPVLAKPKGSTSSYNFFQQVLDPVDGKDNDLNLAFRNEQWKNIVPPEDDDSVISSSPALSRTTSREKGPLEGSLAAPRRANTIGAGLAYGSAFFQTDKRRKLLESHLESVGGGDDDSSARNEEWGQVTPPGDEQGGKVMRTVSGDKFFGRTAARGPRRVNTIGAGLAYRSAYFASLSTPRE